MPYILIFLNFEYVSFILTFSCHIPTMHDSIPAPHASQTLVFDAKIDHKTSVTRQNWSRRPFLTTTSSLIQITKEDVPNSASLFSGMHLPVNNFWCVYATEGQSEAAPIMIHILTFTSQHALCILCSLRSYQDSIHIRNRFIASNNSRECALLTLVWQRVSLGSKDSHLFPITLFFSSGWVPAPFVVSYPLGDCNIDFGSVLWSAPIEICQSRARDQLVR